MEKYNIYDENMQLIVGDLTIDEANEFLLTYIGTYNLELITQ
jgi:hypothetical protein